MGDPAQTPVGIPCADCEHEIPASEAVVFEAVDYVVHFCGLDCYERWSRQRQGRQPMKDFDLRIWPARERSSA